MSLPERLKLVSEKKRVAISAMGPLIGLSRQAFVDIVSGKTLNPRMKIIFGIAEKLDLNPTWLMTGEGEMSGKPTITTESSDAAVQELIKQVNFLQKQVEQQNELIAAFRDRFLKGRHSVSAPLPEAQLDWAA